MGDVVKQRHGCLTVWLILMMIVNGLTAVAMPFAISKLWGTALTFQTWVGWVLAILALLSVFFLVALFKWKKWGFYGFILVTIITCGLGLYAGVGVVPSLAGLIGIGVLYGVLQIGRDKKGWTQLE